MRSAKGSSNKTREKDGSHTLVHLTIRNPTKIFTVHQELNKQLKKHTACHCLEQAFTLIELQDALKF